MVKQFSDAHDHGWIREYNVDNYFIPSADQNAVNAWKSAQLSLSHSLYLLSIFCPRCDFIKFHDDLKVISLIEGKQTAVATRAVEQVSAKRGRYTKALQLKFPNGALIQCWHP